MVMSEPKLDRRVVPGFGHDRVTLRIEAQLIDAQRTGRVSGSDVRRVSRRPVACGGERSADIDEPSAVGALE
jgi:hypothetical protein